jgi:hypothetical protein
MTMQAETAIKDRRSSFVERRRLGETDGVQRHVHKETRS